jgi:hypothetical protein
VVEYSSTDQAHAADEVGSLPDGAVIVRMLGDYAVLRKELCPKVGDGMIRRL